MPSGPDLWNDDQYQRARGLLERPGKSAEFTRKLQEAVQYYEAQHGLGGADDGDDPSPTPAPLPSPGPAPTPQPPAPAPPQPAPAATKPAELPWYEVLTRGARDTAGMGFADEAGGIGAWAYDRLHGGDVERKAGRSVDAPVDSRATSYRAERDAQRADDKRAREESPWLYRTGEAIGLGGTVAAPFSRLGRAAPAVLGAASAAGSSETEATEHPLDLAREVGVGAAIGEAGGQLAGAVTRKVSPLVSRRLGNASERSMRAADKRYLRAAGAGKGALDKIEAKGDTVRYAQGGRRLGIGGGWWPKTPDAFADDAALAAQKAAGERSALEAALKEHGGAPVDPDKLAHSIRELKREHALGGSTGQPLRDEIDKVAGEMKRMRKPALRQQVEVDDWVPDYTINTTIDPKAPLQRGASGRFERTPGTPLTIDVQKPAPPIEVEFPRSIPWSRANKERVDYGNATNFLPSTPRAAIRPRVYGKLNEALADAADRSVPGLGTKWRAAGEDQHIALKLGEFGRGRENAEYANRAISPTDYLAAGGAYSATGDPASATVAAGANRLVRGREQAVLEKFNRNRARLEGAGSRWFDALSRRPAVAAVQQAGARVAAPSGAGAPMLGMAHAEGLPEQSAQQARGQMLPDAAMRLYKQDPAAFGRWQRDIFDARQKGEGQLAAALTRLQDDPDFQREVLPRLQAMTAEVR